MPGAAQWIATADLKEVRIALAFEFGRSGYRAYAMGGQRLYRGGARGRVAQQADASRFLRKPP